MKVFTIDEAVFKTATLFVLDCPFEILRKYLDSKYKTDVGEYVGQTGQLFTFKAPPYRIVWTEKRDSAVILHEVFHLVTRICDDRGVPIKAHLDSGESGDETAAFLFEWYVIQLRKHLRGWTR